MFDHKYSNIHGSKMFPDGTEEETKMLQFRSKILEVRQHMKFCESYPLKARLMDEPNKWTERILVSKSIICKRINDYCVKINLTNFLGTIRVELLVR